MNRVPLKSFLKTRKIAFVFLIGSTFFLGCTPADRLSPEEIVQAKSAFEACLICHSTQEMQRGPIISGLPSWYSQIQLQKFLKGARGQNPANRSEFLMGSARDRFNDENTIQLLSRYIESLPVEGYHPVVQGDRKKGEQLYQSCIPCHGERGQGNELLKSPPLNIQEDWYLLDQLRKFATGKRGYHPEDIEGIQMANTLVNFDDKALKDVITHIQGFTRTP